MIPINTRLLFKTSGGFDWNGTRRWWEFYATVTGYNGAGGYWVYEESCWNGSAQMMFPTSRSLNRDESKRLEDAYLCPIKSAPADEAVTP